MKKLLLIIVIAFVFISILTIMFTFQASSTFNNFTGDGGENGDDNIHLNIPNINQDKNVVPVEDSYIYVEEQFYHRINMYKLSDSVVFAFREAKIGVVDKILPRYVKFLTWKKATPQ